VVSLVLGVLDLDLTSGRGGLGALDLGLLEMAAGRAEETTSAREPTIMLYAVQHGAVEADPYKGSVLSDRGKRQAEVVGGRLARWIGFGAVSSLWVAKEGSSIQTAQKLMNRLGARRLDISPRLLVERGVQLVLEEVCESPANIAVLVGHAFLLKCLLTFSGDRMLSLFPAHLLYEFELDRKTGKLTLVAAIHLKVE
jgi:hypothetical protein